MRTVPDSRRQKSVRHNQAEVLTCLVAGYVTGHTTLRRCVAWCRMQVRYLRKWMKLEYSIASVSTVSRILSDIDEELFLYAFVEWAAQVLKTKGMHIAVDGKAIRAATEKQKDTNTPMILNALDTATSLVLAQLPMLSKENEITAIPQLLKLLDLKENTVTIDAVGTQTGIMDQIHSQGGHFLLLVKKNQPAAYREITDMFRILDEDQKRIREGKEPVYPQWAEKYHSCRSHEKNRERYEYRFGCVCSDSSVLSRTNEDWIYVRSVGQIRQTRILIVRDKQGNDITPGLDQFLKEGSRKQPLPTTGDRENCDNQIVGVISDMSITPEEMGKCKRDHWAVENRLHHVLDDTFREDRSPAKKSKNNLALIRKYAYNLLRIAMIRLNWNRPMTEMIDRFNDDENLLSSYLFKEIPAIC